MCKRFTNGYFWSTAFRFWWLSLDEFLSCDCLACSIRSNEHENNNISAKNANPLASWISEEKKSRPKKHCQIISCNRLRYFHRIHHLNVGHVFKNIHFSHLNANGKNARNSNEWKWMCVFERIALKFQLKSFARETLECALWWLNGTSLLHGQMFHALRPCCSRGSTSHSALI